MKKLSRDQQYLNSINVFSTSSHAFLPYNNFVSDLFSNDIVIDYIYNTYKENKDVITDYKKFGQAIAVEKTLKGFRRLNEKNIEDFLSLLLKILNKSSIDECATMLKDETAFSYDYLELLEKSDVEKYFNITKQAFLAELANSPEPFLLTQEQSDIAYQALFSQFRGNDAILITNILMNSNKSSNIELCYAGKGFLSAILSMKGEVKKWMLRQYTKIMLSTE